jgi:hypothetical protein
MLLKGLLQETEDVAQQLRVRSALVEDKDPVPSTRVGAHSHL